MAGADRPGSGLVMIGTGDAHRSHNAALDTVKKGVDLGDGLRIVFAGTANHPTGRGRPAQSGFECLQVDADEGDEDNAPAIARTPVASEVTSPEGIVSRHGDGLPVDVPSGRAKASSAEKQEAELSASVVSESPSSSHFSTEVTTSPGSSRSAASSRLSSRASSARISRRSSSSDISRQVFSRDLPTPLPASTSTGSKANGERLDKAVYEKADGGVEPDSPALISVREDAGVAEDYISEESGGANLETGRDAWLWEDLDDFKKTEWDEYSHAVPIGTYSGGNIFVPLKGSSSRLNEFQLTDTSTPVFRPQTSVREALRSARARNAQYLSSDINYTGQAPSNIPDQCGRVLKSAPHTLSAARSGSLMFRAIFFRYARM